MRLLWDELLDAFKRDIDRRCHQLRHSVIANAFPLGEGRVPNNHAISAALLAMNSAGLRAKVLCPGWREDAAGRPTYSYEPTRHKRVLVYPTIPEEPNAELTRTEVLWNYVERLEPDTCDVALAVLAQMCEPSAGHRPTHPMLMPVIITDDAILEYKSIDRAHRELERPRIHSQMESLRNLSFDVEFSRIDSLGHATPGLSWQGDRLFDIVRMEQYQDLFGERKIASTTWAVRAGLWACYWFSTETLHYIGRMARVLLSLGNRGARGMARKLGQRLLLLSQCCVPRGEVTIFIRTLLEEAGELLSRAAFEEALAMLVDLGVLKTVEWPGGFGPCDIDREKGWVDPWLSAKLQVRTSASGRAENRTFEKPKFTRPTTSKVTGEEIRLARSNIFPRWSQRELAHKRKGRETARGSSVEYQRTHCRRPRAARQLRRLFA